MARLCVSEQGPRTAHQHQKQHDEHDTTHLNGESDRSEQRIHHDAPETESDIVERSSRICSEQTRYIG